MIIKRMFKFSLYALLLAGGVWAYADGDVKLADGAIIAWTEFVENLNNPPTATDVKGDIEKDLPTTNSLRIAYEDAKQKVDNDSIDLAGKKAAVDTKADPQPKLVADSVQAESELKQAQEAYDLYIKENVTSKKTEYDDAEAKLAVWKQTISDCDSKISSLNGQSTRLNTTIANAEDSLGNLQKAYNALKKDSIETKIVEPKLAAIITDAKNYLDAWHDYLNAEVEEGAEVNPNDKSITIYYSTQKATIGTTYTLYLSFEKRVAGDGGRSTWREATTLSQFGAVLYPESAGENGLNITNEYVYLGPALNGYDPTASTQNNTTRGLYQIKPITGGNVGVIESAYDQLVALSQTEGYYTVQTSVSWKEPAMEQSLRAQIAEKDARITSLKLRRTGIADQLEEQENLKVDAQAEITAYTVTTDKDGKTEQQKLKEAWDNAVANQGDSEQAKAVTAAETKVTNANKAIAAARTAVTTAEAELASAKRALATAARQAQGAADEIAQNNATTELRAKYQSVSLTGDVTVTFPEGSTANAAIKSFNGTIKGNGHIINVPANKYLFDNFGGNLSSVAINGATYEVLGSGAGFSDVARWNGDLASDKGAYYVSGTTPANYQNIGEFGFAIRNKFGIDFADGGKLVNKTPATMVYRLTVYQHDGKTQQNDVLIQADGQYATGVNTFLTLPVNTFAKSATEDVAGLNLTNVFYGANNTCQKVVITDNQDFYCPVDIDAQSVSYARKFKAGMNTVCLPFALSKDLSSSIDYVCEYDREASKVFWFTKVEGNIAANTPVLLMGKNGVSDFTLDIPATTIKQTDAQIVKAESNDHEDKSVCFGILKRVAAGQMSGQFDADNLNMYGLQGGVFKPAASSATFPAFRMVIRRDVSQPQQAEANAPMRIGIRDGFGNDMIFTGVEDVIMDASALDIVGGNGEIIIKAEADYGKTEIYSLDGRVAAVADVIAGTTTVNLQKGVYIVMGKKVLVK